MILAFGNAVWFLFLRHFRLKRDIYPVFEGHPSEDTRTTPPLYLKEEHPGRTGVGVSLKHFYLVQNIKAYTMFDAQQFNALLLKVNSRFSAIFESSLASLQKELSGIKGFIPPHKKQQIQKLIFNLPYEKHVKYAEALKYLADNSGIVVCGKPVKPTMELVRFDAGEFSYAGINSSGAMVLNTTYPNAKKVYSYHHVFDFKFQSSTGNSESLRKVGTREHIKFRSIPGSPPFNANMADTPTEFFWGESKTGAQTCMGRDDHMTKPPSLIVQFPLAAGELVADQWYQYTIDNGATWNNIEGAAYNLIKGVRQGKNGKWVFYFIKKNWTPHNNLNFHFEAEYDILPPMPPPAPGSKLNKANGMPANISDYGRLIRMK